MMEVGLEDGEAEAFLSSRVFERFRQVLNFFIRCQREEEERSMSEFVVVVFNDEFKAEEVRLDLLKMQADHLVDIEDAAVLVRSGAGKVKLHHVSHLTLSGALTGGFVGTMLGVVLMNPVFAVLGLAAGTAMGAVSGSMSHAGIDEEFMKDLAEHLKLGSSALCILVREEVEKVLTELNKFEGKVFRTSLTKEDEEKLVAALDTDNAQSNS